jgi:hypothetical protein
MTELLRALRPALEAVGDLEARRAYLACFKAISRKGTPHGLAVAVCQGLIDSAGGEWSRIDARTDSETRHARFGQTEGATHRTRQP